MPQKVCRPKEHWGAYLWGFIHTVTIIDFENNVPYHETVMESLKAVYNVIPCPSCKLMYQEYLSKLDRIDVRHPMVLFR